MWLLCGCLPVLGGGEPDGPCPCHTRGAGEGAGKWGSAQGWELLSKLFTSDQESPRVTTYSWPFPPELGVTNPPCCQQWPQGSNVGAAPQCLHAADCCRAPRARTEPQDVTGLLPSCVRGGEITMSVLQPGEHKQLLLGWFSWAQRVCLHCWGTTFGVGGSSKRNHVERKRQPKSGAQSHD